MPGTTWNSASIIDDLAQRQCLRDLYVTEALSIAANTGRRFVPDQQFEDALTRTATRYQQVLSHHPGQQGVGNDGAMAAVRALYRILNEEYVNPPFEIDQGQSVIHAFANRLMEISPRAVVAYAFCLRFLLVVGLIHYGVEPAEQKISDVDALIEAAIRNFETNPTFSFEQLWNRVLDHSR